MKDPLVFEQLKDLAIRRFEVENVIFYEDYQKLLGMYNMDMSSSQLSPKGNQELKKYVSHMYAKFIVSGAPYELNVPHKIIDAARNEENFEQLEIIAKEVNSMLYSNTFRQYVLRQDKKQ
ncbi:hypothetical protein O9G_002569 [Rozella allomycis CSF55]|uniref:RGS domain-containing protein n=1 Tax=Rozella allomycis (strain CSF55) TaxID=988480 RepID=A0A075AUM4_ROZAC|nr:hypothetical protein O9G_002569 [Rozella allomycis CSF55]|eukprot:EPZ32217.1 hypothetical protein O9G_002569 [Rozella allomycis CSF55]